MRAAARCGWRIAVGASIAFASRAADAQGTGQPNDNGAIAPPGAARVFDVRRADAPMRVDAVLDEQAWASAERIPLPVEITPGDNIPTSLETDCRISFDDAHLYLGCTAYDDDPGSIRAFITDRDRIYGNHDRISFLVDPFNDMRRGFVFEVTAVGVQGDLVYDERTGFDETWDAIWESAGRITSEGYVIEAAIPFRSLRFPNADDVQTWRFWINRMRPRSVFTVVRTNTRLRDESCQLCQAPLLRGFTGMDPGRNIDVVPTLTGRRSASRAATFPGGAMDGEPIRLSAGVDARWSVTSNLSVNATANPDFSQVEADAAQLDANNAFALRLTEKRPFFLEGADLFRTPLDVIFTRTVVDPSAGVKFTGKAGPHAVALLAARDEVNSLLIPGPFTSTQLQLDGAVTSTALRYRRDVGPQSTIGTVFTGRFGDGAYRNLVGGVDLFMRPTPTITWTAQALASASRDAGLPDDPDGSLGGQAAWTRLAYQGRGWFADAAGEVRTPGFRADLGFLPQTDLRRGSVGLGYSAYGTHGVYRLLQVNGGAWTGSRTNGELLSEGFFGNVYYEGPWQSSAWFTAERRRESFGGEAHDLLTFWSGFDLRPLRWLRLGTSSSFGDEIDFRNGGVGQVLRLSPSMDAQVGRHVELGARHSLQRLEKDGADVLDAHVTELRTVVNVSARAFARGIVQYRSTHRDPVSNPALERVSEESVFSQFLVSYKLNPLTVAFLGLTDDRAGFHDRAQGQIGITPRSWTLFFKLGYAWRL